MNETAKSAPVTGSFVGADRSAEARWCPTGRRSTVLGGLLAAILVWVAPVQGQESAQLTFTPDGGSFDCGEVIEISVMIDASVVDLRGFTLTLEFDPTVITPLEVTAGSLLSGASCPHFFQWVNATAVGDSITADGAGLGCSVAGPGEIVRVVFEGVEEGNSHLRCRSDVVHLRNGDNEEIPHECAEVTIQYLCPIASERSTWGWIKQIYK